MKPTEVKAIPCPKCNRRLIPTGTIDFQGKTLFSYQCDECIVNAEFYGVKLEEPLTFAADRNGTIIDPTGSLPG